MQSFSSGSRQLEAYVNEYFHTVTSILLMPILYYIQLNKELQHVCNEDRIVWKCTPPNTPSFGGQQR